MQARRGGADFPNPLAAVALLGGLVGLLGVYWDDAWHTDRGRDTFVSAPHLVLYGGVALVGLAVAVWAWRAARRERSLRSIVRFPALVLTSAGLAATLAGAPADDAWHRLFGRDAVLWSPPHLLAVLALVAVAGGLLLKLGRRRGRSGRALGTGAAVLLLGAVQVPVMEYETDVPQFATLWYLPVLTASLSLALSLAHTATRRRWVATEAAAAYTVVRVGILGFLIALGHSLTVVAPLVVPAVVFDLTVRWGWPKALRAGALAVGVYAAYVPYLNLALDDGIRVSVADVLLGLPLASVGAWLGLAGEPGGRLRALRGPVATVLATGTLLLAASPALAHDPGQGTQVGRVRLVAVQRDHTTRVRADILGPADCQDFQAAGLIARRAGAVRSALLRPLSACRFQGEIGLPDRGRWFLYLELHDSKGPLEAWLPVQAASGTATFARTSPLYRSASSPGSAGKVVAGAALYLVGAFLLAGTVAAYRRRGATGQALGAAAP